VIEMCVVVPICFTCAGTSVSTSSTSIAVSTDLMYMQAGVEHATHV
jgi:hypothetical protein